MERTVETVFLDWDYTLAYTQTPNNSVGERLAHMFALADLPYSQAEIETAMMLYQQDVADGKLPAILYPQKRRDIARLYGHLFDYLGETDKSWATRIRLYGTYAQLPNHLYEDSRPTLTLLGQQGYKLGIITNHSAIIRPIIERLVGDLVPSDHIVISEEIGVHKPAKTIYRRAAGRLRTPPSRCVLTGDNLAVDAVGAMTAGGYCCGIWLDRPQSGADQSLPEGVTRITALNQLPQILNGYEK